MEETFRDPIPDSCDVLVVGAGPAGLAAAIQARRSGAGSVVLLDGRDPWREPVPCAEGVREESFLRWSPVDPSPWKRGHVRSCILGTVGASFAWTSEANAGWIVDRAGFHAGLSRECRRLGVACDFRTRVASVDPPAPDGFRLVRTGSDGTGAIRARRVVDASGPGSVIGRDEGFATGKDDLELAAFALVEGLGQPTDAIQLWFHDSYSPGGYAWIFPRDERVANVGVVVGRGAPIPSRRGLEIFLEQLAPGSSKGIQVRGGAIPNGWGKGRVAHRGLFKAGDAAAMVNAISRGGIVEALCAGTLAGRHAAESLAGSDTTDRHERAYRKEWMREMGRHNRFAAMLKPLVHRIPAAVLRRSFERLSKVPDGFIPWPLAIRALALAFLEAPFRRG